MPEMRTIEIDFDVHKLIETKRTSFSETPNMVLRRLLEIEKHGESTQIDKPPLPSGRPWSGKGVTLPHGTEVRMEYNGQLHNGRIMDGQWVVEGKKSISPSRAASYAGITKGGRNPSLNGWIYWQVKRPSDLDWIPLDSLR